jgi:hypothetical protein
MSKTLLSGVSNRQLFHATAMFTPPIPYFVQAPRAEMVVLCLTGPTTCAYFSALCRPEPLPKSGKTACNRGNKQGLIDSAPVAPQRRLLWLWNLIQKYKEGS